MADYPGSIKTYTDKVDNVDIVHAVDINSPQDEITAIETELGTLPKGVKANVKTRLDDVDTAITGILAELATIDQNTKYACEGRLSLVSGSPMPSTDALAQTTLYFIPFQGNEIALYTGGVWGIITFVQVSITLAGLAANTNFDVYGYNNAGTLTLELTAWSTGSLRVTGLSYQDGVLIKSGDATRRYLGTIRTTATIGQCEDSRVKRFVWNMYNWWPRPLRKYIASPGTWTYASSTWRQANADATAMVEVVVGRPIFLHISNMGFITMATTANFGAAIGIGKDVTNAEAADSARTNTAIQTLGIAFSFITPCFAVLEDHPADGYHFYAMIEQAYASYTFNMGNDKAGLLGFVLC